MKILQSTYHLYVSSPEAVLKAMTVLCKKCAEMISIYSKIKVVVAYLKH
jgi:hypothetical protein